MAKGREIRCSICGNWFTRKGLPGHMRFKHGVESRRHKVIGQAQRPPVKQKKKLGFLEPGEKIDYVMFSDREASKPGHRVVNIFTVKPDGNFGIYVHEVPVEDRT